MAEPVERADIVAASGRIATHIRSTPVLDLGNEVSDAWSLVLKLEHTQLTGSFKARGALSLLTRLDRETRVVAASGGNFGKAVAYAAGRLGIAATVFVPDTSPSEKTGQIARYGAEVRMVPGYYDDALEASSRYAGEVGAFEAHAYDDPDVMAGQGTLAVECQEQVPDMTTVLVPVGGGGLVGGIASWFRGSVSVVGVESDRCPTLHAAREHGGPVDVDVGGVTASSLGARRLGAYPWSANSWITDSVVVGDDDILAARGWLWDRCRLWVEPAAAVGMAALLHGAIEPEHGSRVVVVLSGGNTAVGAV